MGWWDRFRSSAPTEATTSAAPGWYAEPDGDSGRFVAADGGMPTLHLIRYRDSRGKSVLRLCEDATGLLVGPTDRRLAPAGIYVSNLQGEAYHKAACKVGDFSPGATVRLKREPENPHDPFAVAVTADEDDAKVAAYVNKQKARTLSKLLDSGAVLRAVSLRGTGQRTPCQQIAILAARPEVVAHLLSVRPRGLPKPAHER